MIATLTPNPALDVSTSIEYVLPDRKLRCAPPVREAGGGGINVARAVCALGGQAIACFPAAGPAGDLLDRLLVDQRVPHAIVPVAGWTRENLNVDESVSGRQFRFCRARGSPRPSGAGSRPTSRRSRRRPGSSC